MRYIALILTIFYFSICLNAQTKGFKEELAKADEYITAKQYQDALKHIENVLDNDPLYLDALEKKVSVMISAGNSKEIFKQIDDLIKANIQQPEYYYIRAIINNYRQRTLKAIEDFDDAIYYQMPQKYLDRVYLNRGVAYYNVGRFEEAESDFSKALEINPKYATVYHSWGMLDYEMGRFEDAVKKFNKAIQYGDERAILYYNLGMSHRRLGDMKNACYNFNVSCNKGGYKDACKIYFLQCAE